MGRKLVLACVVALVGVLLAGGVALARDYTGTAGPDRISGTSKRDVIEGRGGDDRIFGRGGNDRIFGGSGGDVLKGGPGNDFIKSKDGQRDTVVCGDDEDFVYADRKDLVYYGCETVRLDVD